MPAAALIESASAEADRALPASALMQQLRDDLTEAWARADGDKMMFEVVGAFVRAAYGAGYSEALQNHPDRYTEPAS